MNIALFCPNWIGDVVMATPALSALRRHFAGARIVGVMKPYVAGVVEGGAWFDEMLFCAGSMPGQGTLDAAYRMRGMKIDLAVLFTNSFRSALIAWLGGCRRIVGYDRGGRGWLLSDRLPPVRGTDGKFMPSPIIDAYNRLAEYVGCPRPGYQMTLHTTAADEAAAEQIWQKHHLHEQERVIALNPGAAFGSAKFWYLEYFAQLAQRLVDEQRAGVVVLCGPGERDMARQIVHLSQRTPVCSLAEEQVSLGLVKACVRRADMLITTDSGPRHFAAAFDKPVVGLFGPTHIAWTETYFPKAVHLQKAVDCGPCQLRVCPLDHKCMKLLTPAEVYDAAVALLRRHMPPEPPRSWNWLPFRRERDRRAS